MNALGRVLLLWSLGHSGVVLAEGPAASPAAAPAAVAPAPPAAETPWPGAPAVTPCLETPVKGLACIPGGPFLRGVNGGRDPTARPQSRVWVQTFYMDTHEVTYSAYKDCEKQGRCVHSGPNYVDFDDARQPIAGVSWYEARAYCAAHGEHLPTEAEWEKAARGTEGWLYPWGNELATCERAVIMDERGRSCGKAQRSPTHADVGRPEPVGTMAPNPYGLYDMSGNIAEWVADWFTPSWRECGKPCQGMNPKGPCNGREPCEGFEERAVRGGSWFWPAEYATTVHRRPHVPANRPTFHHFGFRCAASVAEARSLARTSSRGGPAAPQ